MNSAWIFVLPSWKVCSIKTTKRSTPADQIPSRPPCPLTSLPGIIQFARFSRNSLTCIAPRIARSSGQPADHREESALEK